MKYLLAESFDKVHHMRARLVKNVLVPEYSSCCMPKERKGTLNLPDTGGNGDNNDQPMIDYII